MMGKTKEFSVDLRQKIINFHKSGNSYSTILNWLEIPSSMVQFILKKFGMKENLPGHGRKPKLSLRTAWKLYHEVNIKQRVVLNDITKSLDTMVISVSTCTI